MQIIIGLLKILWLLVPAIVFIKLLNSRQWKGMMGELRVNRMLRRHLNRQVYHSFSSLILPTADGTTQIDHVVVSKYGIFVLETKNMQGMISGSSKDRLWSQQIGTYCREFQNPLHQNYKHLKTLHELLGMNEAYFFSVIVFSGKARFAGQLPDNVVQGLELIRLIKSRRKQLLRSAQVDATIKAIKSVRLRNSFRNRRQHVRHVQTLVAAKIADNPLPCPQCGSPMVLRAAAQGSMAGRKFWGCTRFPACRGTRNA